MSRKEQHRSPIHVVYFYFVHASIRSEVALISEIRASILRDGIDLQGLAGVSERRVTP
jgi:hypothetical protein